MLIGALWLIGAAYLGIMYYSGNQKLAALALQEQQQEKLLATARQKSQQGNQVANVQDYITLSDKLQHLFYPTTLLLDELSRNLPKDGRLMQVQYGLDGKITVSGVFDQMDDVAAYLHNLQMSSYVVNATVKSVTDAPVKWVGPVDDKGQPLSAILQTLGGKLLPRYVAEYEVNVTTIDPKAVSSKQPNNGQKQ
ncbi:PilN domain-containing protein [Aneurinibacillus terranovensis]|uniref:PilN domain-containing protein n=1 Tax=Aneurinibacillus terranovensis TaxID=278991 RepID=UPI00040E1181